MVSDGIVETGSTTEVSPMSDEHFDAVVVGSGFGGVGHAYRLAEAGMSVCLLERGKAYPPGSFPRSPWETGRNFWDPSEGLHGLFDVWSFRGLGGIVASGLGGGSLLCSNVVLRKDRSTFVQEEGEYWPLGYDDLEPHYERHEAMLAPTPYPFDRAPYDRTYKTRAMRDAAAAARARVVPAAARGHLRARAAAGRFPASRFSASREPPRPHPLDVPALRRVQHRLQLRRKNTLDFNYLSLAKLRHGADLRTRCEVKTFAPRADGGYTIDYVEPRGGRGGRAPPGAADAAQPERRPARLAAGTFGTTYLLLKNRSALPGAERAPRDPLLRQRRPAHVRPRDARAGGRRAPAAHRSTRATGR